MKFTVPTWILSALVIALQLAIGDHERAEECIRRFYSDVSLANFSTAGKHVGEAIRLWPGNSRYHAWRGYLRAQSLPPQCDIGPAQAGVVQQAMADYSKSIELNPRDAVVHHNLAWLHHLAGKDAEARKEWEQAVALDPATTVFHLAFGMFLEEQGDAADTAEQYLKAIERSPSVLDSPFFRAFQRRSPEVAAALVRKAIEQTESRLQRTGDSILKARLGKLMLSSGRDDRATELLEQASSELPNLPLVWFNLGELHWKKGDYARALENYAKARALDKKLTGPLVRMGQYHQRKGQSQIAFRHFRSALSNWERMTPVTAAHNERLYGGVPQTIDELLPTTLVWFTSPCDASSAYRGLAELSPTEKLYRERVSTCESIPAPHRRMVADVNKEHVIR